MIKIMSSVFDPLHEVQAFQTQQLTAGQYGATSIFIGTMRDIHAGDEIKEMTLEYYPGMTEKQLQLVMEETEANWSLLDTLVIHRVGRVFPNDVLVLVAVWAAHRGDAFDASRYIMEKLKSSVPFWKKEVLTNDVTRWVEKNTNGYQLN